MHCFTGTDAGINGNHEKYADLLCWISNTYKLPENVGDHHEEDDLKEFEIKFYQWVPFALVLQAIMFYVPYLIWRCLYYQCGVEFEGMSNVMAGLFNYGKSPEDRKKAIEYIEERLTDSLTTARRRTLAHGFSVTICYLVIKVIYVVNSIIHLALLSQFLDTHFWSFGLDALRGVIEGQVVALREVFPHVTECHYTIRVFGGKDRDYVHQCVLPINFYHEKIYVIMWFWLMITLIANAVDAIRYFVILLTPYFRQRFVSSLLGKAVVKKHDDHHRSSLSRWVDELSSDGLFLLRILSSNVPHHTMVKVTQALFERFTREQNNNHLRHVDDDVESGIGSPDAMTFPLETRRREVN